jgi:hypothetical protein
VDLLVFLVESDELIMASEILQGDELEYIFAYGCNLFGCFDPENKWLVLYLVYMPSEQRS